MKKTYIDFLNLIKETVNRWDKKTPYYFRVLKVINVVAGFLLILPALFTDINNILELHIVLLPKWAKLLSYGAALGLWWAGFQNTLVVKSSDVEKTDLPLTENKIINDIQKNK
jgi:hypothetical protein